MTKTIIIIGAGPAGLTAAYELLKNSDKYEVIILEESQSIGGISRTVRHNGNGMDIGGHRYFSKDKRVINWWTQFLPLQDYPSIDDVILNRQTSFFLRGANPEKQDLVMLIRKRLSRIFLNNKFFDYPVKINFNTIKKIGIKNIFLSILDYLKAKIFPLPETNLENFYINNFGNKLYSMFFEKYTEKVWGCHPSKISADWGIQRTKKLSVIEIIKNNIGNFIPSLKKNIPTSLIEEFYYPKLGSGQIWETVAFKIEKMGGKIFLGCKVEDFQVENKIIKNITYTKNTEKFTINADKILSSMPIKDLISGINDVPAEIDNIAKNLPYRDFIIIGLLVKELKLKNETKFKTINNLISDCWIYVQDKDVKLGRIQIFNNWSPYIVKDFKNTVWLGLEYFCRENDEFWQKNEKDMVDFAVSEIVQTGLLKENEEILDYHVEKVKKAYPSYFGSYKDIDKIISYLNSIDNLYCIGRNGQHKYNNMDHSMCTAFEAVNVILNNSKNKNKIWNVNTEKEYQEIKNK